MINKIYTERGLLYGPAMNVVFSMKIVGCSNVENLKTAIDYAVNRFEIMRCRVLQDDDGVAYYVLRESRCKPNIEVRQYHLSMQDFINEQGNGVTQKLIDYVLPFIDEDEIAIKSANIFLKKEK